MNDSRQTINYRDYSVLFVDDEVENLRTFELLFRREFNVVTATSGREALNILNERPIAVVLSDHRMPEMTGTEFLARVREFDPKTVRVLVTAYGDVNTLAQAINDGAIYRYVPKPWDAEEMRLNVRQAIDLYAVEAHRSRLLSELTTLNGVSRQLARELDLGRLTDLLLSAVVEDLGFDGAGILFARNEGADLGRGRAFPPHGAVAEFFEKCTFEGRRAPQCFQALKEGRSLLVTLESSFEIEPPLRDILTEIAAEELLVLPLAGGNGLVGALFVDNRKGGYRFGGPERQLLAGVAGQVGTALENALLVAELRARADESQAFEGAHLGGAFMRLLGKEIEHLIALGQGSVDETDILELALEQALAASRILASDGRCLEPTRCNPSRIGHVVAGVLAKRALEREVTIAVAGDASAELTFVVEHFRVLLLMLARAMLEVSEPGSEMQITIERRTETLAVSIQGTPVGEDLDSRFDPWIGEEGGSVLQIAAVLGEPMNADLSAFTDPSGRLTFRILVSGVS